MLRSSINGMCGYVIVYFLARNCIVSTYSFPFCSQASYWYNSQVLLVLTISTSFVPKLTIDTCSLTGIGALSSESWLSL
jgi:hypothetical protein